MAFTGNYMCTSFKKELMTATHNFTNGANVFKLALYTMTQHLVIQPLLSWTLVRIKRLHLVTSRSYSQQQMRVTLLSV